MSSLGVLLDVVTGRCKCFWRWLVFMPQCIRHAVCFDSFHILVPLNYDCSSVVLENAERSGRLAFELTGLRPSVGWINVHVVTLANASFYLLDSSPEVALIPSLRLHESGVCRLDHTVRPFCVLVLLLGCGRGMEFHGMM